MELNEPIQRDDRLVVLVGLVMGIAGHELRLGRPYRIGMLSLDLVEGRRRDARVERDVAAQVEPVGNVVGISQDLGLRGVALRPFPLLLQLLGELIGVLHALHVAAGAGVAVPVPSAADAAAGLEDPRGKPHRARAVKHVEPGKPGADDHHVAIARGLFTVFPRLEFRFGHIRPRCNRR